MDDQLTKYQTYVYSIKRLQQLSGLWPHNNKTFKRTMNIFLCVLSISITISIIGYIVTHTSSILSLTSALSLSISFSTMFIKMFFIFIHRDVISDLHDTLEMETSKCLKYPEYRPLVLKHVKACSNMTYMLIVSYFGVIMVYLINPVKRIVLDHNLVKIYPFTSYPMSFHPGDTTYWGVILFEMLNCFYLPCASAGVDSAFIYYTFQICGQFGILGYQLQGIKPEEDYKTAIRKCIKLHQFLIKRVKKLLNVYSFIIVWVGITGALVICGMVFQAYQIKQMRMQIIFKFFIYIFAKSIQIYGYGWCGNLITIESESAQRAIYDCAWPDQRIGKDVLIILTQRPMILRIKQVYSVSLDMFVVALNASMSYFFLLRTLDQGKQH